MDWSPILQAVLVAVLPVICAALAAFLISQARLLWARVEAEKPELYAYLEPFAALAVKAAEQLWASGQIQAGERKTQALDYLESYLKSVGLSLDVGQLEAAIEAAVLSELKNNTAAPVDRG